MFGISPAHVQDPALGLPDPHEVCTGPALMPIKVPLDAIPSLQHVTAPHSLAGVPGKLADSTDV